MIKLGVGKRQTISLGLSSKGYYRLAKTYAVQLGLNDQWLKDPVSLQLMNRSVRTRMPGGVGTGS